MDNVRIHLKNYLLETVQGRMSLLTGTPMAGARQDIMLLITGVKRPKAKCGISVVTPAIADYARITGYTCLADRDSKILEWVKGE